MQNPLGEFVLTSGDFLATYTGATRAGVYVLQPFFIPLPPTTSKPEFDSEPEPEIEIETERTTEPEPKLEVEPELKLEIEQEEQIEKNLEEDISINVGNSHLAYAPQAGDSNNMAILYGLLFSALGVLILTAKDRKQSN